MVITIEESMDLRKVKIVPVLGGYQVVYSGGLFNETQTVDADGLSSVFADIDAIEDLALV